MVNYDPTHNGELEAVPPIIRGYELYASLDDETYTKVYFSGTMINIRDMQHILKCRMAPIWFYIYPVTREDI